MKYIMLIFTVILLIGCEKTLWRNENPVKTANDFLRLTESGKLDLHYFDAFKTYDAVVYRYYDAQKGIIQYQFEFTRSDIVVLNMNTNQRIKMLGKVLMQSWDNGR